MAKAKKVLVGCPISSYKKEVMHYYLKGLQSLTYEQKEIVLIDNSPDEELFNSLKKEKRLTVEKSIHLQGIRDMIIRDRNRLREIALKGNFDYFLSLEQDIVPPPDIIERLLENGKDVCSAVYFCYKERILRGPNQKVLKRFDLTPISYNWLDPEIKEVKLTRRMSFNEAFPSRLQQIQLCGVGCMLIGRKVLEKIKFRYEKDGTGFDDIFFGLDCQDNGFEIWLDSRIVCMHHFGELAVGVKERF